MTQPNSLRRFAAWLLTFCQRLSPPTVRDWGEAMLVELEYVEGDWPALAWAAGGAGVLMRRSFIQFLTGRRDAVLAGGPAPLRDPRGGPMRKLTLGLALLGIVVLAGLLFAPSFRQALVVTTNTWAMMAGREPISTASLHRLAERARAERDANTLAFVALELPSGAESERVADEAVQLDPKLTWIYCTFVSRHELVHGLPKENPRTSAWLEKVKAWDPSNAYPLLLEGQGVLMRDGLWWESRTPERLRQDQAWMAAMSRAFAATKFDSYFAERMDLDRDVMTRRNLSDPMLAVSAVSSHPLPNVWLIERYALLSLYPDSYISPVNTAVPVKPAPIPAAEAWKVARFGQVVSLQGQNYFERFVGAWLQREAYKSLAKLAEQNGDRDQQAMFAYQIESLDARRHPIPDNGALIDVYLWNAAAGQAAVAGLLISLILLLVWIAQPALARFAKLKEGAVARCLRGVGVAAAAGLLASCVALYISYHPYAELYTRFVQAHGATEADTLISFWGFMEFPWMIQGIFTGAICSIALLFLAACLLVFEIYRVFSSRGPAQETV